MKRTKTKRFVFKNRPWFLFVYRSTGGILRKIEKSIKIYALTFQHIKTNQTTKYISKHPKNKSTCNYKSMIGIFLVDILYFFALILVDWYANKSSTSNQKEFLKIFSRFHYFLFQQLGYRVQK